MKKIKLTRGAVALVDDVDYLSLNQFNWQLASNGYAQRRNLGKGNKGVILMHWHGIKAPKGMDTDHINGNKLDNRRSNLRIITHQQNTMNQLKTRGISIYIGVSWDKKKNKWFAQIEFNHKHSFLGYFPTEISAAMARDIWAKELFGKFAKLNFT